MRKSFSPPCTLLSSKTFRKEAATEIYYIEYHHTFLPLLAKFLRGKGVSDKLTKSYSLNQSSGG